MLKGVRDAAQALKDKLDSGDTETLKKLTEDVRQALYKLSSAAYQAGAAPNQQQGEPNADFTQQQQQSSDKKDDDGTIDAEWNETKK